MTAEPPTSDDASDESFPPTPEPDGDARPADGEGPAEGRSDELGDDAHAGARAEAASGAATEAGTEADSEADSEADLGGDDAEPDLLDDQADAAEDFVNGLLDVLDMEGEALAEIEDETILLEVSGPEMGTLIGRHGATLEALQELARAAVQQATQARASLVVDIEGYRERQREILERKARSIAARVRKERRAIALDPMTAYERRVVHQALLDFGGVMTISEGEAAERHIVIRPA